MPGAQVGTCWRFINGALLERIGPWEKKCFKICSMGFLFIYLLMPCLVQKGFKAAYEGT